MGGPAPDFSLPDANGPAFQLSSFRGRSSLLLVFFPFAFTPVCAAELDRIRDGLPTYQNDRIQVLAISTDPAPALRAWAQARDYRFPLLSDFWPHGAVARAYGVLAERSGMARRGTFLVDAAGNLAWSELNEPGEPRDPAVWERVVTALPSPAG